MSATSRNEIVSLNVAWGNRAISVEDAVSKISATLKSLRTLHHDFENWFFIDHLNAGERVEVAYSNFALIEQVFERGERDIAGELQFTRGHAIELYTRLDATTDCSNIRFYVGALAGGVSSERQFRCNSVNIVLPRREDAADGLLCPRIVIQACKSLILTWQPVHGYVRGSHANQVATGTLPPDPMPPGYVYLNEPTTPNTGWVVFLSEPFASQAVPPAGIEVEQIPGYGEIWTAEKEEFDGFDPVKVARVASINQALAPLRKPFFDPR